LISKAESSVVYPSAHRLYGWLLAIKCMYTGILAKINGMRIANATPTDLMIPLYLLVASPNVWKPL
jgi:hypothetical protein